MDSQVPLGKEGGETSAFYGLVVLIVEDFCRKSKGLPFSSKQLLSTLEEDWIELIYQKGVVYTKSQQKQVRRYMAFLQFAFDEAHNELLHRGEFKDSREDNTWACVSAESAKPEWDAKELEEIASDLLFRRRASNAWDKFCLTTVYTTKPKKSTSSCDLRPTCTEQAPPFYLSISNTVINLLGPLQDTNIPNIDKSKQLFIQTMGNALNSNHSKAKAAATADLNDIEAATLAALCEIRDMDVNSEKLTKAQRKRANKRAREKAKKTESADLLGSGNTASEVEGLFRVDDLPKVSTTEHLADIDACDRSSRVSIDDYNSNKSSSVANNEAGRASLAFKPAVHHSDKSLKSAIKKATEPLVSGSATDPASATIFHKMSTSTFTTLFAESTSNSTSGTSGAGSGGSLNSPYGTAPAVVPDGLHTQQALLLLCQYLTMAAKPITEKRRGRTVLRLPDCSEIVKDQPLEVIDIAIRLTADPAKVVTLDSSLVLAIHFDLQSHKLERGGAILPGRGMSEAQGSRIFQPTEKTNKHATGATTFLPQAAGSVSAELGELRHLKTSEVPVNKPAEGFLFKSSKITESKSVEASSSQAAISFSSKNLETTSSNQLETSSSRHFNDFSSKFTEEFTTNMPVGASASTLKHGKFSPSEREDFPNVPAVASASALRPTATAASNSSLHPRPLQLRNPTTYPALNYQAREFMNEFFADLDREGVKMRERHATARAAEDAAEAKARQDGSDYNAKIADLQEQIRTIQHEMRTGNNGDDAIRRGFGSTTIAQTEAPTAEDEAPAFGFRSHLGLPIVDRVMESANYQNRYMREILEFMRPIAAARKAEEEEKQRQFEAYMAAPDSDEEDEEDIDALLGRTHPKTTAAIGSSAAGSSASAAKLAAPAIPVRAAGRDAAAFADGSVSRNNTVPAVGASTGGDDTSNAAISTVPGLSNVNAHHGSNNQKGNNKGRRKIKAGRHQRL